MADEIDQVGGVLAIVEGERRVEPELGACSRSRRAPMRVERARPGSAAAAPRPWRRARRRRCARPAASSRPPRAARRSAAGSGAGRRRRRSGARPGAPACGSCPGPAPAMTSSGRRSAMLGGAPLVGIELFQIGGIGQINRSGVHDTKHDSCFVRNELTLHRLAAVPGSKPARPSILRPEKPSRPCRKGPRATLPRRAARDR